jgi:hypothetical protein
MSGWLELVFENLQLDYPLRALGYFVGVLWVQISISITVPANTLVLTGREWHEYTPGCLETYPYPYPA